MNRCSVDKEFANIESLIFLVYFVMKTTHFCHFFLSFYFKRNH